MTEVDNAKPPRPTPKAGAKSRAKDATKRTRAAANDAGNRILEGVEANPLAALAGGIALGVFAGALLPKTEIEGRYLGPLGAKLNEGAKTAAIAAKEAGTAELAAVGLSKVGANEQVGKLLEGVVGALQSAGAAARETRRKKAKASAEA